MAYVIVLGTVFTLTLLARNHIMTNRKIKDFVLISNKITYSASSVHDNL